MSKTLLKRYLIFILITLIVPMSIVSYISVTVRSIIQTQHEELTSKKLMLEKLRNLAVSEKQMPPILQSLRQAMSDSGFSDGSDHASLDAQLQSDLRTVVSTHQAKFLAVRALPDQVTDSLNYIGARLEFSGSLPAVQAVLYAIETRKPQSVIGAATLKSARNFGLPGKTTDPDLDVSLEVFRPLIPSMDK